MGSTGDLRNALGRVVEIPEDDENKSVRGLEKGAQQALVRASPRGADVSSDHERSVNLKRSHSDLGFQQQDGMPFSRVRADSKSKKKVQFGDSVHSPRMNGRSHAEKQPSPTKHVSSFTETVFKTGRFEHASNDGVHETPRTDRTDASQYTNRTPRSYDSRRASEDDARNTSPEKATRDKRRGSSTTLSSTTPTESPSTEDPTDDHINVVLRIRPLSLQERNRNDTFLAGFPGAGRVSIDNNGADRFFTYNVVFEPEAMQEDLFQHCGIKKLIDMAINGFSCTTLAFGQTGSGKTHTMTGPPQQFLEGNSPDSKDEGLIQRSFRYLCHELEQQKSRKVIKASYLEIYNEQVIDLLNPNHKRYLNVRWSKNRGFYVENLFTVECEALDDLMAVLEEGLRNRQTGSHGLNEFSSRSHSMLSLSITSETQDNDDENLYITKKGKLTFVDLAGSEKVKESGASAEQLIESNNINRSLLVLGNCISSLGDPKKRHGHIPYRDSKLTKLLADSLGGNGVTLMVTCITPSSHHLSETMNTLRYASRTKKIVTKPVVKLDPREKLILSLKREIKVLRNENHYFREQLEFPDKPKGGIQKSNDDNFVKHVKEQKQEKTKNEKSNGANNPSEASLYEMLQEYMVENEAIRSENSELNSTKDRIRREQQLLYRENEKLMKRVEELERVVTASPTAWNQEANTPRNGYANQRKSLVGKSDDGQRNASKGRNPPVAARGHPMKPPHRLPEPVAKTHEINGHDSTLEQGYSSPRHRQSNGTFKPANGPSREDSIRSMNEKLKQELHSIDHEIGKHEVMQRRSSRDSYGGSMTYR